jgi:bifunctional ADP-heptose synthase (sugar kinase/adenylyltransferase)
MTKHLKEAERLRKIIEAFPKVTITVLGDLVADEFVFGEISRVSREAPVLILKHRERTVVPGGGANAVHNLAELGVNVLPVGAIGDDEVGRLLVKFFRHKRIPVSGVLKDKTYTTVTKTRILAGMMHNSRQQVVPNEAEVEAALGSRIGQDWEKLTQAGKQVMDRMKLQSLLITRGRDGMAAFDQKHSPVDIPIFGSDEVADVTGAGDTVIATFSAALAAGASTEEAAQLANYAGGIVVMKRGTATVSREELLRAIEQAPPSTRSH